MRVRIKTLLAAAGAFVGFMAMADAAAAQCGGNTCQPPPPPSPPPIPGGPCGGGGCQPPSPPPTYPGCGPRGCQPPPPPPCCGSGGNVNVNVNVNANANASARAFAGSRSGATVIVGDATKESVLRQAGLDEASTLLIAIPEGVEAGAIVRRARAINPQLVIVARAHSDEEVTDLVRRGADHVVMAERETASRMAERAMLTLA